MKAKLLAAMALLAVCLTACDDTTDTIGQTLTDNMDHLKIVTDTFTVTTRSVVADSVLSRSTTGYLGKIKDPETGTYITGDFMVQFHTLDNFSLPADVCKILSKDAAGEVVADSCEIRLFYTDFYGDSLATMKLTAMEMGKAMEEGVRYYSNFNPEAEGYIRAGGIKKNKVYTLADQSISESERADGDLNIRITLNEPYTDKDNVTYNNYGTYLMRKYYKNPEAFRNSYDFVHNICPGFYIKTKEGIGSMAYIYISQLNFYYKYAVNDTTTYTVSSSFAGTEEVLQTTNITNDRETIKRLADDNTCTYLKTPAGIFTEMTLPVEEIVRGHEKDTLNTAKIVLTSINNKTHSDYILDKPSTLLMIPRDSIYTFFEKEDIVDYKHSFLAVASGNTYTFNNVSSLVRYMAELKDRGTAGPNWNKVVIVPVSTTTNASGAIVKVVHDMSLTSARLVGGSDNPYDDIKISVIYSKFSDR